jgi:hypothetical protein
MERYEVDLPHACGGVTTSLSNLVTICQNKNTWGIDNISTSAKLLTALKAHIRHRFLILPLG